MEFPRYVHGPDGEHKLVTHQAQYDDAIEAGYQPTPILTAEQVEAVKAAKIAAGELSADEDEGDEGDDEGEPDAPVDGAPVASSPRSRGGRRKKVKE